MKKNLITIIAGLLIAGLLSFGIYTLTADRNGNDEQPTVSEQQQSTEQEVFFNEDGTLVRYQGKDGKTALEILHSLTTVETETSDFGEFVTAINGMEAGENQFWAFYVNGQQASEGAGTYQTAGSDEIEWRMENF